MLDVARFVGCSLVVECPMVIVRVSVTKALPVYDIIRLNSKNMVFVRGAVLTLAHDKLVHNKKLHFFV